MPVLVTTMTPTNSMSTSAYDQSQQHQHRLGKAASLGVKAQVHSNAKPFVPQKALLETIETRLSHYQAEQMQRSVYSLSSKALKTIDALVHDPNCVVLPALIEVSEKGNPLTSSEEHQQAKAYFKSQNNLPKAWQRYIDTGRGAPHKLHDTSFIHQFTPAHTPVSESIGVVYDLYRPPWKPYYASDVFLHQWGQAVRFSGSATERITGDLQQLPASFPRTFYINNVVHEKTLEAMSVLLDRAGADTLQMPCGGCDWDLLCETPHLRYLERVLAAHNELNRQRGNAGSRCDGVEVYRAGGVYHLKVFVCGQG
jgi:hypothetical protein